MVGLKEAAKNVRHSFLAVCSRGWRSPEHWRSSPEILFMDEPFGALDAITRMKLQKDVLKIAHETDKIRRVCYT